jgi:hypothetical protein
MTRLCRNPEKRGSVVTQEPRSEKAVGDFLRLPAQEVAR